MTLSRDTCKRCGSTRPPDSREEREREIAELRRALDDPARYEWGEGPWEHLGDAERDVRLLIDALDAAEKDLQEAIAASVEAVRYERERADAAEKERDEWENATYKVGMEHRAAKNRADAAEKRAKEAEAKIRAVETARDDWQRAASTSDREVAALRTHLTAVIEALDLAAIPPSLLWRDAGPAILGRVEEIVDEANRLAAERDKAWEEAAHSRFELVRLHRAWDELETHRKVWAAVVAGDLSIAEGSEALRAALAAHEEER